MNEEHDLPFWTFADYDSGGPHKCPVCGSIGTGVWMHQHIGYEHPDTPVGDSGTLRVLKRAMEQAAYALDPNQGERPDVVRAGLWLRTAFPPDHPNYVDPATLD